jgi:hypothetical protein
MEREIKLDGGDIAVIKALGLSGTPMNGKMLMERSGGMASAELIDTITGLVALGYVLSSKVNLQKEDDVKRSSFRVNSSYARELRDALRGGRRRREEPPRRTRR